MQIWSHLLKKSLIENFIFCAVTAMIILLIMLNIISVTSLLRKIMNPVVNFRGERFLIKPPPLLSHIGKARIAIH